MSGERNVQRDIRRDKRDKEAVEKLVSVQLAAAAATNSC